MIVREEVTITRRTYKFQTPEEKKLIIDEWFEDGFNFKSSGPLPDGRTFFCVVEKEVKNEQKH